LDPRAGATVERQTALSTKAALHGSWVRFNRRFIAIHI
jgi:hypothetical protein